MLNMSFDTFTMSAFGVVALAFAFIIWLQNRAHKESRSRINELESQIDRLHGPSPLPSHASRELCCAVRRLYPDAMHGVDFQVADDGEGPYIVAWLMEHPQPEPHEISRAIDEHREALAASGYRDERRSAYPSVGAQLDALYHARQGHPGRLEAIDEQITRVKERFPKPVECQKDCSN